MNNKAVISVIIPIYNSEKNLKQCIQSVLNQSYSNFELLLINDGSTDTSGDICDFYGNKYPQIQVFHKKNSGVSDTRNFGIKKAHGKYITFVDSDDFLEVDYLSSFFPIPLKGSFLISQGIRQYIQHEKKFIAMFEYENSNIDLEINCNSIITSVLLNGCPVAKLFEKKVIVENKLFFNTELSLNEDHIFILNYILNINKIKLVEYVGYNYRFDFLEPTLTKISHPAIEQFRASVEMFNLLEKNFQYLKISNSIDFELVYSNLGFNQLVRSVISIQSTSINKLFTFKRCLVLWSKVEHLHCYHKNQSIIHRIVIYILKISQRSIPIGFFLLQLLAKYVVILETIKRNIKRIILK